MANEVQVFEMIAGRAGIEPAPVNFLTKQTLTIGGAISAAFNRSTTQVRIISTTGCVIEFGSAPDGLGSFFPIVAGQIYDFSVVAGQKVIAVAGTATPQAVTVASGSGGVTEYTEDAASAANPVGAMLMARRRDVPVVGEVSAEGDNIAVNANKFGELRVVGSTEGLQYETVAASQTAQVIGATGAAGDFLSHVILQPTTTGAGTMTILDNATVIFTYTAGTLADLSPITIPINAFSVSGAWKITTGANETATAFGRFT